MLLLVSAGVFLLTMKKTADRPTVLSEIQEEDVQTVAGQLNLVWAGPFDADQVSLIPNFETFGVSTDVASANSCKTFTSAGFYTKENKPVGFFFSNNKEYRNAHESALFNGFLTANQMGVVRITSLLPRDPLVWGVQTGPVLRENGQNKTLAIHNDKNARRVFAAVSGDNQLFVAVVFDPSSSFRGPKLADLPRYVTQLEEETKVVIADAINLDGGSASTFKGKELYLTELSSVGSFLCISE
jgi:uncharacterized protein YigE (DUF2233 family)